MYIEDDKKTQALSKFGKIIIAFTGIILGFIIARVFLFVPFVVQDNSMSPNIKKGDYVIILKITAPKEGDIVLLRNPVEPGKVMLKRLLAGGEKSISIKDKKIFVNNNELIPGWKLSSNDRRIFPGEFSRRDNLSEVKMQKDEIFVLGDNFDYSFDSRTFGPVSKKLIIGRLIY